MGQIQHVLPSSIPILRHQPFQKNGNPVIPNPIHSFDPHSTLIVDCAWYVSIGWQSQILSASLCHCCTRDPPDFVARSSHSAQLFYPAKNIVWVRRCHSIFPFCWGLRGNERHNLFRFLNMPFRILTRFPAIITVDASAHQLSTFRNLILIVLRVFSSENPQCRVALVRLL